MLDSTVVRAVRVLSGVALAVALIVALPGRASLQTPTDAPAPATARVDYLAFTQGAMPLRVAGAAAQLGAGDEQALRAVDGNASAFTVASGAKADTVAEFVYELAAPTTFDRFAVPNVLEAISPAVTFARSVEVLGSLLGPDTGFTVLASATLTPHTRRGEWTELSIVEARAVRWVRLRLIGGLDMTRGEAAVEFTEIVGNGTQEPATLMYRFRGDWTGPGLSMTFRQQGAAVAGCYDTAGELSGTVSGNLLRAVGTNRTDKVRSTFVLGVAADGTLRGMRSTGTGAFRPYVASKNMPGLPARCTPLPVTLACGSTVHAIAFAADTADLLPDSAAVLSGLAEGLRAEGRAIVVEAFVAAADGTPAANQALTERRATAVVDDLVRRGVAADRLRAVGGGSARPLVPGDDEAARVMNRRIEIRCQ